MEITCSQLLPENALTTLNIVHTSFLILEPFTASWYYYPVVLEAIALTTSTFIHHVVVGCTGGRSGGDEPSELHRQKVPRLHQVRDRQPARGRLDHSTRML